MVTDNAHLIALHRVTGRLLWDVVMPDEPQHYGATVAPLIVKDIVIAGVSGGDWGIRGFVAAYKASDGERVWRRWTVPAKGEPGFETWRGAPSRTAAAPPGSPARTTAKPIRSSGPRAIRVRIQTIASAAAIIFYELRSGARSGDRNAEMVLPVHAARSPRLGCEHAARPGRHEIPRAGSKTAAACRSQRVLLCTRPTDGSAAACQALRQANDLGERHRRARPSDRLAGQRASPARTRRRTGTERRTAR